MSLINMTVFSKVLQMEMELNLVLPDHKTKVDFSKCTIVYLLHGHGENQDSWLRYSKIESLVRKCDVIFVLPCMHRSFYVNGWNNLNYFDYLSIEIPEILDYYFSILPQKEKTYVMGNSMGGYGAFKLALEKNNFFSGAISLSGALCPYDRNNRKFPTIPNDEFNQNFYNCYGSAENFIQSNNNLFNLIKKVKKPLPKLLHFCGTEDYLTFDQGEEFKEVVQLLRPDLELQYVARPGKHNWLFWNECLEEALHFMEIAERKKVYSAEQERAFKKHWGLL